MSGDPKRIVTEAVNTAISGSGETGIQVAAYLHGDLVIDTWGGLADETTNVEVDSATLFPVFSVIKAVTAVALHIQAERGLVEYDAPLAKYWPEFGAHGKDRGTVSDALTHRIGVPFMPFGVTPELMCDWDWMVDQIANMRPLFEPGTKCAYMAYTFGWVVGEVVRRTDPKGRSLDAFVQDEICRPLGIDNLWMGVPDEYHPRIAKLTNAPPIPPGTPGVAPDSIRPMGIPPLVGPTQEIFGRTDVRRACIPGAGGYMNARSEARFFAMLANGGKLDGIRLLSEDRVRQATVPRPPCDYDLYYGVPHLGTMGGFHLAGSHGMQPAGNNPRTFGHTGAGGSVSWADPDAHLAVGITHNRMFQTIAPATNPLEPVGAAVRRALEVAG